MICNINQDEVHIFYLNIRNMSAHDENHLVNLTVSEKKRAARFKSDDAKSEFIIGRSVLRTLISRYLSVEAECVDLSFNNYGKPLINPEQNRRSLKFNLSHSGKMIVFIFCLGKEAGIDTEEINYEIEHKELARHFCSPAEFDWISEAAENEQTADRFFTIWTRKESVIKAEGTGISDQLREIEVLNKNIPVSLNGSEWSVTDLHLDKKYKTAFAYPGTYSNIILNEIKAEQFPLS